jgi:hypothetical protein
MEVASRPSLELLVDLPLEEPLDATAPPREPPTLAAAPVAAPAKDLEQTDLNFIDPELFLAPDELSGTAPIAPPAAPLEQPAPLELALEDPVVDELLMTSPVPPPPPPAAPPATLTATRAAPAAPHAPASAPGASRSASSDALARVPIARTAALTVAAAKLAAASAAHQQRFSDRARSNPASPVVPAARPKPADQPAPRVEAPSFAGWASARAATAQAARPSSVPVATAAAALSATPPAIPARSATPKAAASAPAQPLPAPPAAAQTPAVLVSPPMDRDFVARNQVVERYLSGRLPLKGATDFERFCHQHPELLDEIGLPERVNAGLRLLEASGKPEPWQEAARPLWQKPQAILGLAAAALVLVVALVIVAGDSAAKSHRITALQKQALERPLDPATSTREIRLLPSRSGASNTPAINIGGGSVHLADFKIDESRSPYHAFRVTIDRIDQGRVGVITNLTKDSNGHLRIALNSSALGPGNYQLTIEGLNWRGEAEPDSWITIGIVR